MSRQRCNIRLQFPSQQPIYALVWFRLKLKHSPSVSLSRVLEGVPPAPRRGPRDFPNFAGDGKIDVNYRPHVVVPGGTTRGRRVNQVPVPRGARRTKTRIDSPRRRPRGVPPSLSGCSPLLSLPGVSSGPQVYGRSVAPVPAVRLWRRSAGLVIAATPRGPAEAAANTSVLIETSFRPRDRVVPRGSPRPSA